MFKLPTSLGPLKSAVPGANTLKAAAAKAASPASVLSAAKGAAGKVNVGKMAAAAATGNVKGAMGAAANAAKTAAKNTATTTAAAAKTAATGVAQNTAVSAAAAQVPGGNAAVKMAKNMGIPSATILSTIGQGPGILDKIKLFFTTMDTKTMVILGGIVAIFLLLLVGMIIFFTQKKASNFQNVTDTSIVQGATLQDASASIGAQVKGFTVKGAPTKKEGFANATGVSMETDDLKLINLQPLTVKQAGFIGPLDAGVFQEATAVTNTLKAGVRTFFFQVDYHEDANKDSKLFPGVKEPCLLYRDDSGVLTSTNAGSILKMSQAIADIGISNSVPSQNDQILMVL